MKTILKILAAILVLVLVVLFFHLPSYLLSDKMVTLSEKNDDSITIMSANVRFLSPTDLFSKSWFNRADLIAEDIDSVKPDIIGFQEVTFVHYDYLKKVMAGYESEMAYRDDFVLSEGCPIFYRTDRFEKIDSGSFWLSETPDEVSLGWDGACNRICTWVVLENKETGEKYKISSRRRKKTCGRKIICQMRDRHCPALRGSCAYTAL